MSGNDLYNGYLFNRHYMAQPGTSGLQQNQPTPYNQGRFYFVPSGTPPTNSSCSNAVQAPIPSSNTAEKSTKISTKNRWDNAEVKILIASYKEYYDRLKTTKSSRGKKSTWDLIYDSFIEGCTESQIKTTKTLVQVKEKWRVLFDKYKAVVDNNNKTGRGRIDFEHFDDIDEFMGHSDKVNPKFVKESGILDDAEDDEKDNEEVNAEQLAGKTKKKSDPSTREQPAKKQRRSTEKGDDTSKLIDLLEKQQEAMLKAEESDRKALETIVNMQNDAEKRHQEFMVAVLGKLGDIFSKK